MLISAFNFYSLVNLATTVLRLAKEERTEPLQKLIRKVPDTCNTANLVERRSAKVVHWVKKP